MSDDAYKDIITGAWAESLRRTVKTVIAEHAGAWLEAGKLDHENEHNTKAAEKTMTQLQKRIGDDDEDNKDKPKSDIKDDVQAQGAVQKAKALLDKIKREERERPRDGHFEICCGVKTWVPD